MDTVRMLLLTMQLFCLVLSLRQVFDGVYIPRMDKEVNDTLIKLDCTVGNLDFGIVLTYPNNSRGQAYCFFPVLSVTQCNCSCDSTPECHCNITQDISTNTTSLQIMGNNLTDMFGWYTCAHGSYKKSILVTRHVLWLETEVKDEMIKLRCTPDELTSMIYFYFPHNSLGHAYCIAPSPSQRYCKCSCNFTPTSKCNITQDLPTKTTTLQIMDTNLTSMFGWYTCAHGSYNKSALVTRPSCTCRTFIQNYADGVYIAVCTLTMTIAICISIVSFVFPDIPGRIKKFISHRFCRMADETANTSFKEKNGCATCYAMPICGICFNCKNCYCETCCRHHLNMQGEHRVSQIQHVLNSQIEIKCDICLKLAGKFCGTCWEPCCASCAKSHKCPLGEKEIIIIYQDPSISKLDRTESVQEKLNHIDSLSFEVDEDPVRICGVGYLLDGSVVALDGNNRKLIVFKSRNEQLKKALHDEPCAMATMTRNEIAVTFPYKMHIRIYTINLNIMENIDEELEHKDIKMSSLGLRKCKPFSIAYNKGYLAVEVGEGEDGMIIIVDINRTVILERIKCKFAFFTGHTIRLALNMIDGLLYVSAMGKKMVTCMDFKGNKVWHKSIPGPRSIIVPEDNSLGEIIILSSRRCNVIYKINEKTGDKEMLKAQDEINSPRFIAYNNINNRLCALVQGNGKTHEDELAIFEFTNHDEMESTRLLVDGTEQNT